MMPPVCAVADNITGASSATPSLPAYSGISGTGQHAARGMQPEQAVLSGAVQDLASMHWCRRAHWRSKGPACQQYSVTTSTG